MKKQAWNIRIIQEVTLVVDFEREVTKEEALVLFDLDKYDDIIDERDHETLDVIKAE